MKHLHNSLCGLPVALGVKAKGIAVAYRAPASCGPLSLRPLLLLSPLTSRSWFPKYIRHIWISGPFSCSSPLCDALTPESFMAEVHISEFAHDSPGLNSLTYMIIISVPFTLKGGLDDKLYDHLPAACSLSSGLSWIATVYSGTHLLTCLLPPWCFSTVPLDIVDLLILLYIFIISSMSTGIFVLVFHGCISRT